MKKAVLEIKSERIKEEIKALQKEHKRVENEPYYKYRKRRLKKIKKAIERKEIEVTAINF